MTFFVPSTSTKQGNKNKTYRGRCDRLSVSIHPPQSLLNYFSILIMDLKLLFQASGLFLLSVGIWMELQLHKYMELSTFFSTTIPLIFVSLGGAILCLSLLACCCTAKGKVPLLYRVSHSHVFSLVYRNVGLILA